MQFLEDSALTNIKHMIHIAHNSLLPVEEDTNLSPEHHNLVVSARMCLIQMNRIINLSNFLANADNIACKKEFQLFEIKNLIEEITNVFYNTLIRYVPIDIKLSFNLKETTAIIIDPTRFELAVLNLLYCSLKMRNSGKADPVKLNITVSELQDNVVLRIKDNSKPVPVDELPDAFLLSRPNSSIFSEWSQTSLLALSLKAARTATEQMDGQLLHSTLKSGNRFDIYLPRQRKLVLPLQSITKYSTTKSYVNEIAASIIIEDKLYELVDILNFVDDIKL